MRILELCTPYCTLRTEHVEYGTVCATSASGAHNLGDGVPACARVACAFHPCPRPAPRTRPWPWLALDQVVEGARTAAAALAPAVAAAVALALAVAVAADVPVAADVDVAVVLTIDVIVANQERRTGPCNPSFVMFELGFPCFLLASVRPSGGGGGGVPLKKVF